MTAARFLSALAAAAWAAALLPAVALAIVRGGEEIEAARYIGGKVSMPELDRYVASRYAKEPVGKESLDYEIRERVLEQETKRRGVRVPDEELKAAIQRIDTDLRAQTKHSLDEELAQKGMDRATFEEIYRKQLACERMVRADVGVAAGEAIRPEQQELWLADKVKSATVARENLPAGVHAEVNGEPVTSAQLGSTIRLKLSRAEVRDALRNMIGVALVEARAKELGITADAKDIEAAIDRRRERFANNPKVAGVAFEQLLQAKGLTLDDLRKDGGVRGEALLQKLGDALFPDAEVDRRFAADKAKYEGYFGDSKRVSWILMHATSDPNSIVKKTYEEVEAELKPIAARATSAAEFSRLATIYSTDTNTKRNGGLLGWVHRAEPGFEPAVLAALFAPGAGVDKVLGPVRNSQGSALLWVHEERPAPSAAAMRLEVRGGLVVDFYRRLLEDAKITTYLDPRPEPASRPSPAR